MSGIEKLQNLRDGYQPRKDDETRGYHVTQSVDLNNLKIPKNLSDAAVAPLNVGNTAPAQAGEPKKD